MLKNASSTWILFAAQTVVVLGVAFFALGGFQRDFHVPLDFWNDTLVYLAQAQGTLDNGWWWVNHRIGAPFAFHALLFPSNSNVDQLIVWLIGRFVRSAALGVNLAWLSMLALSGLAASFGLRTLGCSRIASFVGGMLFALSPYALYRQLGHFAMVTYLMPFPAALAVHLASGGHRLSENRATFIALLAGCALLGFNYVYYAFFGCFFLLLATVIGVCRSRERHVLQHGMLSLVVTGFCVFLNLVPSFYVAAREGTPIVVHQKVAAEAEVYGLKIRHLVSPVFQQTLPPLRSWVEKETAADFPLETENKSSRLGLIGAAGFAALLAIVLLHGAGTLRTDSVALAAGRLTVAGLLLATIGGFGSLFNLIVTPEIRAYNRITPFIAFFALLAVAAGIDVARRRGRALGIAMTAAVLALGMWDQTLAFRGFAPGYPQVLKEYTAVRAYVTALEDQLPDGAMVLQLPFTVYLNDVGHERMQPYDHFKPYLVSRRLRWSYPALSNAQFAWQEGASHLGPADLASFAVEEGFAAILVDKFGYADGAAGIGAALKSVPGTRALVESDRYLSIDIRSVARSPSLSAKRLADLKTDAVTTASLPECSGGPAVVSIDRLGDNRHATPGSSVGVSRRTALAIEGWAVMPVGNRAGEDVEIAIDGVPHPAAYGFERPDVAAYLGAPESLGSGFRASIPTGNLPAGTHTLNIRVVAPEDTCFYQSAPISVSVQ